MSKRYPYLNLSFPVCACVIKAKWHYNLGAFVLQRLPFDTTVNLTTRNRHVSIIL